MHATVRSVIEAAGDGSAEVCVLDTEASPEHLTRGTARYADTMLVVVEPWFKSLETGRRIAALAKDLGIERVALVANKIRDDADRAAVRELAGREGLELAGVVPYDEALTGAERVRKAPLDFAPDAAAIAAIGELAQRLSGDGRA
jgi:CO dehydrogenase maturation factor